MKRTPANIRRWARKGGHAVAAKLTPKQRKERASRAAHARWKSDTFLGFGGLHSHD